MSPNQEIRSRQGFIGRRGRQGAGEISPALHLLLRMREGPEQRPCPANCGLRAVCLTPELHAEPAERVAGELTCREWPSELVPRSECERVGFGRRSFLLGGHGETRKGYCHC